MVLCRVYKEGIQTAVPLKELIGTPDFDESKLTFVNQTIGTANLFLESDAICILKDCETKIEWNIVTDRIKKVNHGFPYWWWNAMVRNGLDIKKLD